MTTLAYPLIGAAVLGLTFVWASFHRWRVRRGYQQKFDAAWNPTGYRVRPEPEISASERARRRDAYAALQKQRATVTAIDSRRRA